MHVIPPLFDVEEMVKSHDRSSEFLDALDNFITILRKNSGDKLCYKFSSEQYGRLLNSVRKRYGDRIARKVDSYLKMSGIIEESDRCIIFKRVRGISTFGRVSKSLTKPLSDRWAHFSTIEQLELDVGVKSYEEIYSYVRNSVEYWRSSRQRIIDSLINVARSKTMAEIIRDALCYLWELFQDGNALASKLLSNFLTLLSGVDYDYASRRFSIHSLDPKKPNNVVDEYLKRYPFLNDLYGLHPIEVGSIGEIKSTGSDVATFSIKLPFDEIEYPIAYVYAKEPYQPTWIPNIEITGTLEEFNRSYSCELNRIFGKDSKYAILLPQSILELYSGTNYRPYQEYRAIKLSLDFMYQCTAQMEVANLAWRLFQKGELEPTVMLFDGAITPPDSHILDLSPGYSSELRISYICNEFNRLYNLLYTLKSLSHLFTVGGIVKRLRPEDKAPPVVAGIDIMRDYAMLLLLSAAAKSSAEFDLTRFKISIDTRVFAAYAQVEILNSLLESGEYDSQMLLLFMPIPRKLIGRSQLFNLLMPKFDPKRYLDYADDPSSASELIVEELKSTYFGNDSQRMQNVLYDLSSFEWIETYILPLNISSAVVPKCEILLGFRDVSLLRDFSTTTVELGLKRMAHIMKVSKKYAYEARKRYLVEDLTKLGIKDVAMYVPESIYYADEEVGRRAESIDGYLSGFKA